MFLRDRKPYRCYLLQLQIRQVLCDHHNLPDRHNRHIHANGLYHYTYKRQQDCAQEQLQLHLSKRNRLLR